MYEFLTRGRRIFELNIVLFRINPQDNIPWVFTINYRFEPF